MTAQVTLVGTLGGDPELRFTTGGKAVANFNMAVSRRYQVNNEWQEETSWFRVSCWQTLAENVAASLAKGSRVVVAGRLETREYEKDGVKRTATEVVADEVGASLRWATAEIARVVRDKPLAPVGARPATHDPVYGDEEAF